MSKEDPTLTSPENRDEPTGQPVEQSRQPDTDVPSDYFDGCTTYLSILDRIEQLSQQGKVLQGSSQQYDAARLNSKVWEVIRSMSRWTLDLPVPVRETLSAFLGPQGVTNSGGLRAALIEAVVLDCENKRDDARRMDAAREALKDVA